MTLPNPGDKTVALYTTFEPDKRIVVSEAEAADLEAQGLVAKHSRAKDGDKLPDPTTQQG
jgi:hypothetical protein